MTGAFAPHNSVSVFSRRPASITAAALLGWAYALALVVYAVRVGLQAGDSVAWGSPVAQPPVALAAVTGLAVGAALLALGSLALWQRKTGMLLVFALWVVGVGATCLAYSAAVHGSTAAVVVRLLAAAATAVPIVLLLRRRALAWLPPIPLHDAVLVIVFGPIVGLALIAARQREMVRLGIA